MHSMHSSRDVVVGNMDLVTEILLRLPVKHILRCKCVCKKWLALISDPRFCYSHTLRLCDKLYPRALLLPKLTRRFDEKILRYTNEMKARIIPVTNFDDVDPSPIRILHLDTLNGAFSHISSIVHSCNGLLLCQASRSFTARRIPRLCSYYVCNPAIDRFVHLDYPSVKFHPDLSMAYLDFQPLKSPQYKVILFNEPNGNDHWVGVYSSETRSWNEVGVCFSTPPNLRVKSGVYCNGVIHWYTLGEDFVHFEVHRFCFNTLPGPVSVNSNDVCVKYFGESGGNLQLILVNSDESLDFDIWELKEDYSGWAVKYHVNLNLMGEGEAFSWQASPSFSVLCVVRQSKEKDSTLVLFIDSKIMSYNLKDHTPRFLCEVDEVPESFQYFETLSGVGLDYTTRLHTLWSETFMTVIRW